MSPGRILARLSPLVVVAVTTACTAGSDAGGDTADRSGLATPLPTVSTSPAVLDSAAAVGTAMRAGVDTLTSAHVELGGACASGGFSLTGDVAFAAGRVSALAVDGPLDVGSEIGDLLIVDDTAYVRPESLEDDDPDALWRPVTAASTDPTVTAVADCVAAVYAVTGLAQVADAFATAMSFDQVGVVVGGERYSFAGFTGGTATGALASLLGNDIRPTNAFVDLDGKGRPLTIDALVTLDGDRGSVRATFRAFDAPVDIEAPAADEVEPG